MSTALHGKTAEIYWDSQGTDTNLQHGQAWSVELTEDVIDITSMQDIWQTFKAGFMDWTATVDCLLDTGGSDISTDVTVGKDMGDVSARLELYLVWDTGTPLYKSLYGECICTGITPSADKDNPVKVTYTFQGTGTLVWDSGAGRP